MGPPRFHCATPNLSKADFVQYIMYASVHVLVHHRRSSHVRTNPPYEATVRRGPHEEGGAGPWSSKGCIRMKLGYYGSNVQRVQEVISN